MKSTLEKRILIFAFLVLTLTIAVNTGVNIEGFRRDYRDGIILRCQNLATGLKSTIEKVLSLGIPLEEMEGISARCQEIVGTDPEIAYALIENSSGTPLYSSDPSFSFPYGATYSSTISQTTTLLTSPTVGDIFDVSFPLYAPKGELAGRIHIGFLETVLKDRIASAFRRALIILGVAFIAVFAVVILFAKRDLVAPIGRLIAVAKEIASGNFLVPIPRMSTKDFSELAVALENMATSLQERDGKIREGYRELEETNLELQRSYEYQEQIGTELKYSKEMYRSLLEDASDAIVVSDENDRIVLVNKSAENFFGLSRDEAIGMNLFSALEVIGVANIEEQYFLHQKVLSGKSVESELHFLRPSDRRRMVGWVMAAPVVGKDGRKMVQAVFRDVTRDKETKDNLERSARELEQLNRMKDTFLGMASHELKTPLTVIVGYCELLLGEASSKVDRSLLPMISHISDAAERLSLIVRDMVDVSMLDGKTRPLRIRDTDINLLVQSAIGELEYFFSKRHQHLEVELDESLPYAKCDPERLIQAVTNIVGNAIKFTPDGGTVKVMTRTFMSLRLPHFPESVKDETIKPLDSRLHTYIEIAVQDTGIGVDEQDQIHIFEKFYEGGKIEEHFTAKTAFKGKGTGLGLTIARGFVNLHGGEIWVESAGHDPEKCPGSLFRIILPLEQLETSSPYDVVAAD